ncbi:MAG TPA: SDR family NAD(P)-dependent oxidoreductase [Bacteroidales bacterium]|nr:SDR family NAD(P)-dependent oxidoreductase [Bacteroidales bacterium]
MNNAGKKIFITGSTDGLGKLVARHMAEQGAEVLLHGRNEQKGKKVLDELKNHAPKAILKYYNGDFSSLKEVSDLADRILKEHDHIDILINNAAIGSGKASGNAREESTDGLELRMSVNYFAQVLLTEKLLPLLKPGSNIINVASTAQARVNFSDLMLRNHYDGYHAYSASKTALVMYTFDLAERLREKDIKVNAVHPSSLMNTNMVIKDWGYTLSKVEDGAEAVENLLSPELTGAYFDKKKPVKAISQAYDLAAREELRSQTFRILGNFLK